MRTLLTIAQLKKYRSISDYCKVEALNPFVNEAAIVELRNLLGKPLYNKFVEDISPLNYPALEPYIEPVLAYYSYARWLSKQQVNVTAFGVVQKRTDFSDAVNDKTLMRLVGEAREMAKVFEQDLIEYLNENPTTYPEWKQTCVKRSPNAGAIRIGAVGNDKDINDFVKEEVNKYGYIRK
jgi:hypothetical protein